MGTGLAMASTMALGMVADLFLKPNLLLMGSKTVYPIAWLLLLMMAGAQRTGVRLVNQIGDDQEPGAQRLQPGDGGGRGLGRARQPDPQLTARGSRGAAGGGRGRRPRQGEYPHDGVVVHGLCSQPRSPALFGAGADADPVDNSIMSTRSGAVLEPISCTLGPSWCAIGVATRLWSHKRSKPYSA